ncbi:MAG: UDP-N-acetylmuramoyl-tripeptide--D-alanyl-D-alanine ligase, partial [Candidatus Competibacter sp.]
FGGGRHFMEMEALIATLAADLKSGGEAAVILVKGSRGMKMERVVTALVEAGGGTINPEGHG